MIDKKTWEEFRSTGLLLIINQLLHIFGWAIIFETDGETVKNVYPARVKFRGFDNSDTSEAYTRVTEYLHKNADNLLVEVNETDV